MANFNTGNPLGSTDPRDLLDNATIADHYVDDTDSESWPDRFGRPRRTWHGIEMDSSRQLSSQEDRFQKFLLSSGYVILSDYINGPITFTARNQITAYNGEFYRPKASVFLPYTTTGNTDSTWEADKDNFVSVGDAALRGELASSDVTLGGNLVAYHGSGSSISEEVDKIQYLKEVPKIYYGTFFENGSNVINMFTSPNGISMSDPIRIESTSGIDYQGVDPSVIYYKGSWFISVTASSASDGIDFIIFRSEDLVTWDRHNIVLNNGSAICSNSASWDTGTIAASKLWAPEFSFDPVSGSLYLTISILLGVDSSVTTSTANYFGTYICKLTDLDSLKFSVPTRLNTVDNTGTTNGWSRIDANIQYDSVNSRYIQVVKRENYSIIDTFECSTIDGTYTYLGTIDALKTSPGTASSGYYVYSGIEGCFPFLMRDNATWVVGFDQNGTTDGILYVTTTDFKTFSAMSPLRMPKMRHGTIVRGDLTLDQKGVNDLYKAQLNGSGYLPVKRSRLNFVQIKSNIAIIPRADTVYWASSTFTVTLITPSATDIPKNFYFCTRSNDRSVYLRVTGAIVPGNFDIGWGINNNKVIEFFFESLSSVYRSTETVTSPYTGTNLVTDAGSTAINQSSISWVPRNGRTYIVNSTVGAATIYQLPDMPIGTYFNVVIQNSSTSFAGLTLKANGSSNHMGNPSDYVYYGGNVARGGFDSVLIRIEKGSDLWFATSPGKGITSS
ncbi:hypothetical protein [Rosenbergiella metrosideri]|uniref:hypothetical protein n=1 Tax=Rosenbergiella metrosideri TaxID=2921185 RepID=UPI001F4F4531|nr:hypothetical protein [Rosenbergiella metrosideri]